MFRLWISGRKKFRNDHIVNDERGHGVSRRALQLAQVSVRGNPVTTNHRREASPL